VGATSIRGILSFLLPGGLLLAASVVLVRQPDFSNWLTLLERIYPAAVFAVALLLGWRFDRSRLVFATLIIAVAERSVSLYGTPYDFVGRITFDAVATLLPLNLAALALLKERGLFTWHGLGRWLLFLWQPLAIALLIENRQFDWLGLFDFRFVAIPALGTVPVEQPALLAFTVAIVATAVNALRRPNALEFGFFWAALMLGFAFLTANSAALFTFHFATSLLILVIAIVEMSYGMAFKDELTGLPARRALEQALLKLGSRYTIAMIDIDHFKKFNDRYGHDVGDQVLRMVAERLAKAGGGGKAYRYGGEEFTVLFPGKRTDDALSHTEKLREAVESAEFVIRSKNRPKEKPPASADERKGDERVRVTISTGLAERSDKARTPADVIKAADEALYRAKDSGRNRVTT